MARDLTTPLYRRAGYHIGSGAIESANKFIGHVRLKRSGAWWYETNANNILTFRCAKYNGTYGTIMERYREINRKETYAKCYPEQKNWKKSSDICAKIIVPDVNCFGLKKMFSKIKLIVYDFDGVMTDNRVMVFQDGTEAVLCSRSDGLGINGIRQMNIHQLVLSTEKNSLVGARAGKLKIECIQGCEDKKNRLLEYCTDNQYSLEEVLYVGNDVNDLEVMRVVGVSIAPSDSHPAAMEVARLVTKSKGGEGVVQELFEYMQHSKMNEKNGPEEKESK